MNKTLSQFLGMLAGAHAVSINGSKPTQGWQQIAGGSWLFTYHDAAGEEAAAFSEREIASGHFDEEGTFYINGRWQIRFYVLTQSTLGLG